MSLLWHPVISPHDESLWYKLSTSDIMKAVRQVSSLVFQCCWEPLWEHERGQRGTAIIWNAFYSSSALLPALQSPGYQSRKSDSNKSSGPCGVNFGVKRTSNIKKDWPESFCLALGCSGLKCGDKIQGTERATPHSSPASPIPFSLLVKIQLLFYLFKMLNIPKSV